MNFSSFYQTEPPVKTEYKKLKYRTRNSNFFSHQFPKLGLSESIFVIKCLCIWQCEYRGVQQLLTVSTSSTPPEVPFPHTQMCILETGIAQPPSNGVSKCKDWQTYSGSNCLSLHKQNAAAQLPSTPWQTRVILCMFYFTFLRPTAMWKCYCNSPTWEQGVCALLVLEWLCKVPDTGNWHLLSRYTPDTGYKATAAASMSQTLKGSWCYSAHRWEKRGYGSLAATHLGHCWSAFVFFYQSLLTPKSFSDLNQRICFLKVPKISAPQPSANRNESFGGSVI